MTVAVACAAALAAGSAVACAAPEGLYVEGPAISPSPRSGPVYVADDNGLPLERPISIGLTGAVSLSALQWEGWGGPTAEASGKVSGSWCLPECLGRPFSATITFGGLERRQHVAYYSRATVVSARLSAGQAERLHEIPLHRPKF